MHQIVRQIEYINYMEYGVEGIKNEEYIEIARGRNMVYSNIV